MQSILKELDSQKNWKEFIKKSCRKNKIGVEIAAYFTPNKIKAVYDRFLKLYETKTQDDATCWFQNELKAFHWFLVVLSGLKDRDIENFVFFSLIQGEQQWKIMGQIFANKEQSIMQYEAIKLVNQRANKNRQWSEQETQILTEIIKGEWEEEEDKLIVKYILFNGRRWSNVAKELGNHRTQHMVKNRFKTLIIRQKKLTPRIANENTLLRQIGKRILGQEELPKKKQTQAKEENVQESIQLSNISEVQEQEQKLITNNEEKKLTKKAQLHIPQQAKHIMEEQPPKQQQQKQEDFDEKSILRDPILSQVVEDCSKGIGSVSTPLSSYELQQIYSPFYINYQGLTPYLSSSPALPFFMNSSFSALDNSFNNNLFIRPGSNNSIQRKQETQ